MRVTLDKIAQKANVSASTVSRVLNNYAFVDESTRLRVWAVARELGYPLERLRREPDATHSVLITGMSQTNFQSTPEFVAQIQAGIETVLSVHGVAVRTQTVPFSAFEPEFSHYATHNPGLLGLILVGGNMQPSFLQKLHENSLPYVIVGGHTRSTQVNCVMADYLYGIEQAVNYLVGQGRRALALVNGSSLTYTSHEKYNGFRLALALNNLAYVEAQVVESNYTAEGGYESARKLLERFPDVDAILCADDYIAVGVLSALQERGLKVPADVAVIGCHNYSVAAFTSPPLTTISLNMRAMGMAAAKRLWSMIEQPEHREAYFLFTPTELVIRSTA